VRKRPTTQGSGPQRANAQAEGPSDSALVLRVRNGDGSAFTGLVVRYQDRVFNLCWRMCGHLEDARDLTQEAFLHAYRSIGDFRLESRFYTWLYRIAANQAISHRRKMRYRSAVSLDAGAKDGQSDGRAGSLPDPRMRPVLERMEDIEGLDRLADAVRALEADHRSVVVLRDIEGMNYTEIAEVLGVPVGTVRSRLHRARAELLRFVHSPETAAEV